MFSLNDYNYELPESLISQYPEKHRDQCRLLTLNKDTGEITHLIFNQLYDYICPNDVLVINNTEVVPGRLTGEKETGGKVEILILNYADTQKAEFDFNNPVLKCLVKASKKIKDGKYIFFAHNLKGKVLNSKDGIYTIQFLCNGCFETILYKIGRIPLPPYIKRTNNEKKESDKINYQTVFAAQKGAIAAPTAGLHFTDNLLNKFEKKGIKIAPITLHVGYGTFSPVRTEDIRKHKIHSESYFVSKETAEIINNAKKRGNKIFAVGTTTVRTLEFLAKKNSHIEHGSGNCDLFIYPGYSFKITDAMITNFHLPKSTLMMLVSAFAKKENILNAYREAVNLKYNFFSYGDGMLII